MPSDEIVVTEYMLASALIATGAPLKETRLGPDGRVQFAFDDAKGKTSALLKKHTDKKLKVSTSDMIGTLVQVKRSLFDIKRERGWGL